MVSGGSPRHSDRARASAVDHGLHPSGVWSIEVAAFGDEDRVGSGTHRRCSAIRPTCRPITSHGDRAGSVRVAGGIRSGPLHPSCLRRRWHQPKVMIGGERVVVDRLQRHDLDPASVRTGGGPRVRRRSRMSGVHAETAAPCWHATSAPPLASRLDLPGFPRMVPTLLPMPWMSHLRSRDDVAIDDKAPRQLRCRSRRLLFCDHRSLENGFWMTTRSLEAVSPPLVRMILMCPTLVPWVGLHPFTRPGTLATVHRTSGCLRAFGNGA
jgi:hypothetical protein